MIHILFCVNVPVLYNWGQGQDFEDSEILTSVIVSVTSKIFRFQGSLIPKTILRNICHTVSHADLKLLKPNYFKMQSSWSSFSHTYLFLFIIVIIQVKNGNGVLNRVVLGACSKFASYLYTTS